MMQAYMMPVSVSVDRYITYTYYYLGDEGYLDFDFSAYQTEAEVLSALDLVSYKGYRTNTTGGLYIARTRLFDPKYGNRPNVTNIIILITDGVPTVDADKLQAEVDLIKAENIKIIAVGVTDDVGPTNSTTLKTNSRFVYANAEIQFQQSDIYNCI